MPETHWTAPSACSAQSLRLPDLPVTPLRLRDNPSFLSPRALCPSSRDAKRSLPLFATPTLLRLLATPSPRLWERPQSTASERLDRPPPAHPPNALNTRKQMN